MIDIDDLNTLLGDSADNYTAAEKNLRITINSEKAKNYTNRTTLNEALENCVLLMCVEDFNRKNSEGLNSESYAGNTYNYNDGYSADIMTILRHNRVIRQW